MNRYQARMKSRGIATKPILIDYARGKRLYWAPARYVTIGARTMGSPGRRWTLRELAQATGYTVSGLRQALRRLGQWGAIRVSSSRGWKGFTRIAWASDVSVARANVSTTTTYSLSNDVINRTVQDTLTPETPQSGGLTAARARCAAIAAGLA